MRPHLFLSLAEELAAEGGAAQYRSAISRAHYAEPIGFLIKRIAEIIGNGKTRETA